MWAEVSFRFVTMNAFDRQTDGRTDGQKCLGNTVRCITCSRAVKTNARAQWQSNTMNHNDVKFLVV